MKTLINRQKVELANVKTDANKTAIELSKKNKVIKSINSEIINIYNTECSMKIDAKVCLKAKETNLIASLKKQMNEMDQELRERKEELDLVKKSMKITRVLELTEENKIYNEEINKLLTLYENSFRKCKEYE